MEVVTGGVVSCSGEWTDDWLELVKVLVAD